MKLASDVEISLINMYYTRTMDISKVLNDFFDYSNPFIEWGHSVDFIALYKIIFFITSFWLPFISNLFEEDLKAKIVIIKAVTVIWFTTSYFLEINLTFYLWFIYMLNIIKIFYLLLCTKKYSVLPNSQRKIIICSKS